MSSAVRRITSARTAQPVAAVSGLQRQRRLPEHRAAAPSSWIHQAYEISRWGGAKNDAESYYRDRRIVGCYPIHESERLYVNQHGLAAFWDLDWDPYNVRQTPAVASP